MKRPSQTIRQRLDRVRQLEYLTLDECCLLVSVGKRTIRRRLPTLESAGDVLRSGRIVRVRRLALLRLFRPS